MKIKELELPQDTKIYQLHFPSTFEAHPNIIVKGKADEKDNRGLLFTQSYKNVTDLQGAIAWYEFLKKNCPEEWLVSFEFYLDLRTLQEKYPFPINYLYKFFTRNKTGSFS